MFNLDRKQRIYVLALGGTIASVANQHTEEFYNRSSININELIAALPFDPEKLTIVCDQILHQISHEISHDDLFLLAKKVNELVNSDDVDGIVITHGTNSIEETAYFLSLVINTKKPIVFTGSFRPFNALGYDGDRNLYNAILLASNRNESKIGVVLTFNDGIVSARDASKLNPSVMGNFSINGSGVIGFIQSNKIRIHSMVQNRHTYRSEFSIHDMSNFAKIFIIYGHIGMDSTFVKAAIENNAQGIISAGMGKGYQPNEVTEALNKASCKGVYVVRCSRTGQGFINTDEKIDDEYGIIAGGSLNPQKARILLAVALSKTRNKMEIQRIFNQY